MYSQIRTGFILISLTLLLFACAAPQPVVQSGSDAEVLDNTLHKVENAAVTEAYVVPGFNINDYKKILIDPLDVSVVAVINPDHSRSDTNWQLNEEDRAYLAQRFRTSMIKNFFGLGGYTAATGPGPGVLRIHMSLTQVGPAGPANADAGSFSMWYRNKNSSAGAVRIIGVVEDSGAGETVARFVDVRQSRSNWALSNELKNPEDAKQLFESWARLFVFRLQENRKENRVPGKVW